MQLVDDIILLGGQAGAGPSALQNLDRLDSSRGKFWPLVTLDYVYVCVHIDYNDVMSGSIPSCAAEDIFVCRLLERNAISSSHGDESVSCVKEALTLRQSSTRELMKVLQDAITCQSTKLGDIARTLLGNPSVKGNGYFPFSVIVCIMHISAYRHYWKKNQYM